MIAKAGDVTAMEPFTKCLAETEPAERVVA
jgi:hypothetical protein